MKPYYEQDGITIYHGDCRDVLPLLPSVDVTITDPPYGETTHNGARTGRGDEVLLTFPPISYDDLRGICEQVIEKMGGCDVRMAACGAI